MIYEISKDFEKLMQSKVGGKRLQNNLRASSIGNPCDRFHYYSLTEYKDPHNWELQSIFDEGNLHEKSVEKTLREMGYEVEGNQREFRLEEPLITMHIDGMLRKDGGEWYPFDSKSISNFGFAKINSAEDIILSKQPYQRNYATQILLYMFATNSEFGCLIFKDKQTGKLKDIWFSFSEHISYVDEAIKRAQRVYLAKDKKEAPERTEDRSICEKCDFRNVCLPDIINNGGMQFLDSADLAYKLDRREELKPMIEEYNNLDEEIKETVKSTGIGEKTCGNYLFKVSEIKTMRKKPITFTEEETSYLKVGITKIGE